MITRGTATAAVDPDQEVYSTISRTIAQVIVLSGWTPEEFRRALGLTRSTYYGRASGDTRWSAAEVKRAADVLGVSVSTLYEGLDLSQVLPHRDSNTEPAGYPTSTGNGGGYRTDRGRLTDAPLTRAGQELAA